jgi:hypothetical protein
VVQHKPFAHTYLQLILDLVAALLQKLHLFLAFPHLNVPLLSHKLADVLSLCSHDYFRLENQHYCFFLTGQNNIRTCEMRLQNVHDQLSLFNAFFSLNSLQLHVFDVAVVNVGLVEMG